MLDIGDIDRVAFVFLDEAHALETPTALTIDIRHPGYPTTADTQVDQDAATVTLGKAFPLAVRERLAAQLTAQTGTAFVAADLAAGTGCVEYLHTVAEAGHYRYHAQATAPSTSAAQAVSFVRSTFDA